MDLLHILEFAGVTSFGGLIFLIYKLWKASRDFKQAREADKEKYKEDLKTAFEADVLSRRNAERIGKLEKDSEKTDKRLDKVDDEIHELDKRQAVSDTRLEERTRKKD